MLLKTPGVTMPTSSTTAAKIDIMSEVAGSWICYSEKSDAMNESEWLACTDPTPMLEFLRTQRAASERKLRLFAVACCRRVLDWLGEKSRHSIDALERYLDGVSTAHELQLAAVGAYEDWIEDFGNHHPSNAAYCAVTFQNVTHHDVALGVAAEIAEAVRCEASISKGISLQGWPPPHVADPAVRQACIEAGDKAMTAERAAQCHLLREIFHGPRRAVYLRGHWRTATILNLASAIYNDRRFEEFPILADALMDAGCHDAEILGHSRQPGPHVRGCWVVDLLLGKA
jgi:hypothetical protein